MLEDAGTLLEELAEVLNLRGDRGLFETPGMSLRSSADRRAANSGEMPDRPGKVDALPFWRVATIAVLKDERVVRHGVFTGAHEVMHARRNGAFDYPEPSE